MPAGASKWLWLAVSTFPTVVDEPVRSHVTPAERIFSRGRVTHAGPFKFGPKRLRTLRSGDYAKSDHSRGSQMGYRRTLLHKVRVAANTAEVNQAPAARSA